MENEIAGQNNNQTDFLKNFKDPKKRNLAVYLGLGAIIFFLITASLAPQLGKNLGLLSQKKNSQKSFAQEEIANTVLEKTSKGWSSSFGGLAGGDDYAKSLAVNKEGNIYLVGSYFDSTTQSSHILLRKYTTDGEVAWTQTANNPDYVADTSLPKDQATRIKLDAAQNLIITGYQSHSGTKKDVWLAKFTSDGQEVWSKNFNSKSNDDDVASDLAIDKQGNIYIVGTQTIPTLGSDILLLKYTATGNLLWQKNFTTKAKNANKLWPGNDQGTAITISTSGEIYISGNFDYSTEGKNQKIWLAKIDPNGSPVWETVADSQSQSFALTTDQANNVYLVGRVIAKETDGNLHGNGQIQKYSPENKLLATAIFDPASNKEETFQGINFDQKGVLYATGAQVSDIIIKKYDTNLKEQGQESYSGTSTGLSIGTAIASDSKGNVIAAANQETKGEKTNFVLLKYTNF